MKTENGKKKTNQKKEGQTQYVTMRWHGFKAHRLQYCTGASDRMHQRLQLREPAACCLFTTQTKPRPNPDHSQLPATGRWGKDFQKKNKKTKKNKHQGFGDKISYIAYKQRWGVSGQLVWLWRVCEVHKPTASRWLAGRLGVNKQLEVWFRIEEGHLSRADSAGLTPLHETTPPSSDSLITPASHLLGAPLLNSCRQKAHKAAVNYWTPCKASTNQHWGKWAGRVGSIQRSPSRCRKNERKGEQNNLRPNTSGDNNI